MTDSMLVFYICVTAVFFFISGYFYRDIKGEVLASKAKTIFDEKTRLALKIGEGILKSREK